MLRKNADIVNVANNRYIPAVMKLKNILPTIPMGLYYFIGNSRRAAKIYSAAVMPDTRDNMTLVVTRL